MKPTELETRLDALEAARAALDAWQAQRDALRDLAKTEGALADLRRLLARDPIKPQICGLMDVPWISISNTAIAARIETLTLAGVAEYLARARLALADLPRLQREAGRNGR